MASVTMCAPQITPLNVEATVDLASTNLTHVEPLGNLTAGQGQFTQYAGNITGAPLYGQAYNGLNWTNLVSDPFVSARAGAIQLQLPAAVFQNAVQSAEGLTAAFVNNTFSSLSATVYVSPPSAVAGPLDDICAEQISLEFSHVVIFRRRATADDRDRVDVPDAPLLIVRVSNFFG